MGANESWICQGRQEHGWFGTGTCDGDCAGGCESGVPGTFYGRLDAVVLSAIEASPRPAARRALAGMTGRTIKTLHQAMLCWLGMGTLGTAAFRERYLPTGTSDEAAGLLRHSVGMTEWARTSDEMREGSRMLA